MSNLVSREGEARNLVSAKIKQIETLVGADKQKASAYGSALVSLSTKSNLVDCSIESILDVGFQIVQAGLNPNPLFNEAYVVPFKLKSGGTVAQLQVGVKGYVTLAYRAGWIIKSRIVYKCDHFSMDLSGFDELFDFIPAPEKQNNTDPVWVFNNIVGVIVMARDSKGNEFKQFVPNSKIEQIRMKSQNQKNPKKYDYIWAEWSEEMVQAKAVKYVIKRLPIGDNVMDTIIQDEAYERGKVIEHKPAKKEISTAPDMSKM